MNRRSITITKISRFLSAIHFLRFFWAGLAMGIVIPQFPAVAEEPAIGFLFDHFQLTLEEGWRTEAAGPFYYQQQADSESTWALPPLFSCDRNPLVEAHEDDFLYPLLSHLRYGHEHRWQLFQLLSTASGREPSDADVKRFTLYPIYFQQRATDTNLNYTAFVPFYGRLKNRLYHDEIYFVGFPIFSETRKRDVVTDNYVFPFVSVSHGDGLAGWQVWPFVGHEHKDVTTETNGFGDTAVVGGHDQSFIFWPIYLNQTNGIGTDNPERFYAAIPFFAVTRSPQRDSTAVLWPVFAVIDDRAKQYHEWQGPWPFVIFTHGADFARIPAVQRVAQQHQGRRFLPLADLHLQAHAGRAAGPAAAPRAVLSVFTAGGKKHRNRGGTDPAGYVAVFHLAPRFQGQ